VSYLSGGTIRGRGPSHPVAGRRNYFKVVLRKDYERASLYGKTIGGRELAIVFFEEKAGPAREAWEEVERTRTRAMRDGVLSTDILVSVWRPLDDFEGPWGEVDVVGFVREAADEEGATDGEAA
jgi:hypothetical protein